MWTSKSVSVPACCGTGTPMAADASGGRMSPRAAVTMSWEMIEWPRSMAQRKTAVRERPWAEQGMRSMTELASGVQTTEAAPRTSIGGT